MVIDPIADMLTRIRNAQMVNKKAVSVPYSMIKEEILKVMKNRGYIEEVSKRGRKVRRSLEIGLLYDERGEGRLSGLRRISKQSQRMYWRARDMRSSKRGLGTYVVSTSKGVVSSEEAKKMNIGGEVLCEIW